MEYIHNSCCFIVSYLRQVRILEGKKHEVTHLCPSPDGINIAVGYEDGSVRIFSLLNGESNVSFNGHKTAVTAIQYDSLGARLVTGSRVRPGFSWSVILVCHPCREQRNENRFFLLLFCFRRSSFYKTVFSFLSNK